MGPFPDSPRVIYRINPLDEVICQVRFPPVLRIEAEIPARFQDEIRSEFPLYEKRVATVMLPSGAPPELRQLLGQQGSAEHVFGTPDGSASVTLTREFLALSMRNYKEWPAFHAKLERPLKALEANYSPQSCVRVGLRYRDQIVRSRMGLIHANWHELIRAEPLGELGVSELRDHVRETLRQVVLTLDESESRVRVVHGLQDVEGEQAYVIDADFFTGEEIAFKEIVDVLTGFNRAAGNLFRWFINPRLHNAMGPDAAS